MKSGTTLIISDLHTNYKVINTQIRHAQETCNTPVSQVMILGDLGLFEDELKRFFRHQNNRFLRPVFFIEGNHEDYSALPELILKYMDVMTHLPRGSVHQFGPWSGLSIGGASYMDSVSTPPGSAITEQDIELCRSHHAGSVDLIFSHDCPSDLGVPGASGLKQFHSTGSPHLKKLTKEFHPQWWFFGHHHQWFDLDKDGIHFIGLPQSWEGFVLLRPDGDIVKIKNTVCIDTRPRWKRFLLKLMMLSP